MRDIRGDLQDRADQVSQQIGATKAQFNKLLEQLKLEHQAKLEELKSGLEAVRMVMKTENRLGSRTPISKKTEPNASKSSSRLNPNTQVLIL